MAEQLVFLPYNAAGQLTSLSFGMVGPGSSADMYFRVQNTSTRYTAQGVRVGFDETNGGVEQLYLSFDGLHFASYLQLGDMPAAATSVRITLRRITPSFYVSSAYTIRLRATVAGWATPIIM